MCRAAEDYARRVPASQALDIKAHLPLVGPGRAFEAILSERASADTTREEEGATTHGSLVATPDPRSFHTP